MITLLVVFAALVAACAWFFWPRGEADEPTAHRRVREAIDYTELDAAERDVREAEDADSVRDWGPGATPPPQG